MVTVSQITPIPISSLTSATTLTGNEAMPMVQNNQTVQAPVNQLPQGMTAGVLVYGNTGGSPFPNYRTLAAGNHVTITDGGAQGDLTISLSGNGVGTVTTTGSPASGNLTKFSAAESITNGDLSGDISTSGTLVTTLPVVNSNVGSFYHANITVNAKGLITAAQNGTDTVLSVSGTTNRITSSGGENPVIDISAAYVGQNTITTLGTVVTGVWNGTTIAVANGGTGQVTANAAFNALAPSQVGNTGKFLTTNGTDCSWSVNPLGTVTTVSVVSANGLAGTVATATTTPAITLSTSITGILKGNGTAISAAQSGTDYVIPAGNVATATAFLNARTIGGVSFDGTANIVPQTIQSIDESADTTCFPLFINASGTQSLQPKNCTSFTFSALTSTLAAINFTGAFIGNATTASTATNANNVVSVAEAADTTCFPLFISASGSQTLPPLNSTALTFNANTGGLGAASFIPTGSGVPFNGVYLPSALTIGLSANTTKVAQSSNGQWNFYVPVDFSGNLTVSGSILMGGSNTNLRFLENTGIIDTNNNPLLLFNTIASAVNNLNMRNAATGNNPQISVTGSGSNISLDLVGKGTGGVLVKGTGTNDAAAAGYVGELLSASVSFGSQVALVTTAAKTIVSLSLTAGDWDVSIAGWFYSGSATVSSLIEVSISATDNTVNNADGAAFINESSVTFGGSACSCQTGPFRVSLSGTTTYYFVALANFSVSTLNAYGTIRARRMR